jgi:hypothetical protein
MTDTPLTVSGVALGAQMSEVLVRDLDRRGAIYAKRDSTNRRLFPGSVAAQVRQYVESRRQAAA